MFFFDPMTIYKMNGISISFWPEVCHRRKKNDIPKRKGQLYTWFLSICSPKKVIEYHTALILVQKMWRLEVFISCTPKVPILVVVTGIHKKFYDHIPDSSLMMRFIDIHYWSTMTTTYIHPIFVFLVRSIQFYRNFTICSTSIW